MNLYLLEKSKELFKIVIKIFEFEFLWDLFRIVKILECLEQLLMDVVKVSCDRLIKIFK